jgi:hypothetical protein
MLKLELSANLRNPKSDNLAVAREKQINIKNGAAIFREKKEKNNKEKGED